ncbi:MAG: hypothetical protein GY794_19580 [bacterium]|nr:hypothetical protein [bacterium]
MVVDPGLGTKVGKGHGFGYALCKQPLAEARFMEVHMMNLFRCFVVSCALVMVSACGSAPVLHDFQEHDLFTMERPDTGTARVVFIRPQTGAFTGPGVVAVYDGDELIGGLSHNGYFVYDAEPGEHLFGCYSSQPGMDFMKADIAGGRTYYVQCSHQDRVLSLASHVFAIKKGSNRMNDLHNVLSPLRNSVLTDEGVAMFIVRNEPAGKHILDTRAGMFDFRIEVDLLREEWLERSKEVQKAWLLTADGL